MWIEKLSVKQYGNNSLMALLIAVYCLFCYSVWLLDKQLFWRITTEDGLLENLTAGYFLLCSGLSLFVFINSGVDQQRRNYWFLLLALLFIVFCGEEISWGQRILNLQTPENWKQINVQQELNLHNLIYVNPYDFNNQKKPFIAQLLTMNAIYAYFVFGFCVIVPWLNRTRYRELFLITTVRLPIVPLTIGYFFVLTYLIDKTVKYFLTDITLRYPNEEIREHLWAFLFLLVCLHWTIAALQQKRQKHSA